MLNIIQKDISSIPIVHWDAHGCPPFKIGASLSFLNRYKKSGVDYVSLNVGFDLTTQHEAIELLRYFRKWITDNSKEYAIAENIQQLIECKNQNKLCMGFDIEGSNILNNSLEMVSNFYTLGVRQLVFSYNNNNEAGGGCLDTNIGLTPFGRDLVKECNTVGMMIDCSHVSQKTSLDIIEYSEQPIIFSHSNPATLIKHPRNITDEQIIACAKKDGVIGINGIGIFLGNNDIRTEKIVEHIDYVVQLIGSEYVGIGLDCVFDHEEIQSFIDSNPKTFPEELGFNNVAVAQPEQFSEIPELLNRRGYSERDINNILGLNFLRVATKVWR